MPSAVAAEIDSATAPGGPPAAAAELCGEGARETPLPPPVPPAVADEPDGATGERFAVVDAPGEAVAAGPAGKTPAGGDPFERALFRDGWLLLLLFLLFLLFGWCTEDGDDDIPGEFDAAAAVAAAPEMAVGRFPRSPATAAAIVTLMGSPEAVTWAVPPGTPGGREDAVGRAAAAAAAAACAAAAGPPAPPLSASQSRPSASLSKSSTPLPARYQLGGRTAAAAAAAVAAVVEAAELAFLWRRIILHDGVHSVSLVRWVKGDSRCQNLGR